MKTICTTELTTRVMIEQEVTTPNVPADGGQTATWEAFSGFWCHMKLSMGSERLFNAQPTANRWYKLHGRFIPGVTPKMRVTYKGRTFNIRVVDNVDENSRDLILTVEENAGE